MPLLDDVSVSIFLRTLLGYYAEVMYANFKDKFDLNTANDGASAKASPVSCTNGFREKQLSILASCMTNLSESPVEAGPSHWRRVE